MADQLATLQTQACAVAEALETVIPEFQSLGLSAAFRQSSSAGEPRRDSVGGMREGLDDLLTMVGQLSGLQMRTVAAELRRRHGLELDSLQTRRLRLIAGVRERGRVTSDAQWYLLRSRIDEISGLDTHVDECEALQHLADAYEFRQTKA